MLRSGRIISRKHIKRKLEYYQVKIIIYERQINLGNKQIPILCRVLQNGNIKKYLCVDCLVCGLIEHILQSRTLTKLLSFGLNYLWSVLVDSDPLLRTNN